MKTFVSLIWVHIFLAASFLFAAEGEVPAPKENALGQQLIKIERQIKQIQETQKTIDAKHAEVKKELANLRVWIHRR